MPDELHDAVTAQRGVADLPTQLVDMLDSWPTDDLPRACYITAHTLHHEGAPPEDWQPWLALAAWGCALHDNARLARSLALLAQVYPDIAAMLPASVPVPRFASSHALTHVLGLTPADEPPPVPDADRRDLVEQGLATLMEDDYLAVLADAITREDWPSFTAALDDLAAVELEGRTPDQWNAELSPGYEPVPAALVAVARDAGFPVKDLAAETRGWVWPAVDSVPGIVPATWPPVTS